GDEVCLGRNGRRARHPDLAATESKERHRLPGLRVAGTRWGTIAFRILRRGREARCRRSDEKTRDAGIVCEVERGRPFPTVGSLAESAGTDHPSDGLTREFGSLSTNRMAGSIR